MTPNVKPLVCGNWKMNGLKAELAHVAAIEDGWDSSGGKIDLALCPPFTLIGAMADTSSALLIGAQDCHVAKNGAHTGDISVAMLNDAGASLIICGHSERRADHGETNSDVKAKAKAIIDGGVMPIICIGETESERKNGETLNVVAEQLAGSVPEHVPDGLVIAYEPVWAIGTGLTPSADDVAQVHAFMRQNLVERFGDQAQKFRLLYGGSVKPANAEELMGIDHVDGALVGGASLKPEDFLGIAAAYNTLLA